MKKLLLIIFIILVSLLWGDGRGAAQTTVCTSDTVLLVLSTYTGNIQWQESTDSVTWTDISGATFDTALVTVDTTTWYRAEIIESTCLPIYSGIEKFIAADCFTCGTDSVQDVEGNWYNTVLIGTQCWFKENMRTTKYPDNTVITKGPPAAGADWSIDSAWYSCPPNSGNTAEDCAAAGSLGMLFQWSAAMYGDTIEGAQGVCPTGWHIPTDVEWKTLEGSLGMTVVEQNNTGWRGTNEGSEMADDVTDQIWTANVLTGDAGFATSGLKIGPSGYRGTGGNYNVRSFETFLWSSTESGAIAWIRDLGYLITQVFRSANNKAYGFSVRCVKD